MSWVKKSAGNEKRIIYIYVDKEDSDFCGSDCPHLTSGRCFLFSVNLDKESPTSNRYVRDQLCWEVSR